jgi:WD40 repeat protein
VTSSGTDRTTRVWDCRSPAKVLHTLRHGAALPAAGGSDAGVNVALWTPCRDRFYTGASDGVIKVWDVQRGDPLVNNLDTLDGHIMCAAFSPSFDSLMVGVSSGSATLFSPRGDRGIPPAEFKEYTVPAARPSGAGGNGAGGEDTPAVESLASFGE